MPSTADRLRHARTAELAAFRASLTQIGDQAAGLLADSDADRTVQTLIFTFQRGLTAQQLRALLAVAIVTLAEQDAVRVAGRG